MHCLFIGLFLVHEEEEEKGKKGNGHPGFSVGSPRSV